MSAAVEAAPAQPQAAPDAWAVDLGDGQAVRVGPLTLEKTLRLLDALQALTAASSTAEDAIASWVEGEVERLQARAAQATQEQRDDALAAYRTAVREATPEATDAQVEAHAHRMLVVAEPPDTRRRMARMLPFIYREARGELVRVLALAVIDSDELEGADLRGQADEALDGVGRRLRHHASLGATVRIVALLAQRLRDEATDDALGEALASCKEAFTALQAAVSDSPQPAPNGSRPSTPGRG
jgi:tetratricopeptide (TPR) repeat protein